MRGFDTKKAEPVTVPENEPLDPRVVIRAVLGGPCPSCLGGSKDVMKDCPDCAGEGMKATKQGKRILAALEPQEPAADSQELAHLQHYAEVMWNQRNDLTAKLESLLNCMELNMDDMQEHTRECIRGAQLAIARAKQHGGLVGFGKGQGVPAGS